MNELVYVGEIELGEHTDVTDPCYDKDVWCRTTVETVPGKYGCYVEYHGNEEPCVARSTIIHESILNVDQLTNADWYQNRNVALIGVDAGLAGYFNDKPDFSNEEWRNLCSNIFNGDKEYFFVPTSNGTGFATSTGWGDGTYVVEGIKNFAGTAYVGLRTTFIFE